MMEQRAFQDLYLEPALGGVLGEQRQLAAGVGSPHRRALTRSFEPPVEAFP